MTKKRNNLVHFPTYYQIPSERPNIVPERVVKEPRYGGRKGPRGPYKTNRPDDLDPKVAAKKDRKNMLARAARAGIKLPRAKKNSPLIGDFVPTYAPDAPKRKRGRPRLSDTQFGLRPAVAELYKRRDAAKKSAVELANAAREQVCEAFRAARENGLKPVSPEKPDQYQMAAGDGSVITIEVIKAQPKLDLSALLVKEPGLIEYLRPVLPEIDDYVVYPKEGEERYKISSTKTEAEAKPQPKPKART